MVDTMNLLTGILPGVQVIYCGEEIGMQDTAISFDQCVDAWVKIRGREKFTGKTRDVGRTPMQWDNTLNAGKQLRRKLLLKTCNVKLT